MFPLIFNLHLIHQKQKTECGSRTEVTHLDQDWCRISSCVFYRVCFIVCVCVCLCVCTRRWWGLFSLLSVILAVAKMGGMKRNIAYWPADEAVAVIAQTNRTWWLLQEDWEMGNRGTAWSPAADSCVCVCVCACVSLVLSLWEHQASVWPYLICELQCHTLRWTVLAIEGSLHWSSSVFYWSGFFFVHRDCSRSNTIIISGRSRHLAYCELAPLRGEEREMKWTWSCWL